MKKIIAAIAAFMICAVCMVSCGGNNDTPTQVTEKFFKAFTAGDVSTIRALTQGEEFDKVKDEDIKKGGEEMAQVKATIKVLKEEIAADGKTATVKIEMTMTDPETKKEVSLPMEDPVKLTKTDKGWVITGFKM